ncbi:MAG: alpha/beta fold hydrolase [Moraxellaceae bacterium]
MSLEYFTTRLGHKLALSCYGPENGPPILFMHGGGQTRHAWGRSAAALGAEGWRAIAIDMRGHGDSDWTQHYKVEDFAADVQEIALAQTSKAVMVGASLGGLSALLANASEKGEVSRALVLVDIAPRLNAAGVDRILGFMAAHTEGFASLDEAAAAVAAYQPQRIQKSDNNGLKKNLRQKVDGRWYWHWDPAMLAAFQRGRDENDSRTDERLYHAAEKLTQPVLLVRGAQSDVVDEEITREFRTRIPQARIADVTGAGHMVAGDRNDVFTDAVREFLTSLS